MVVKLLTIDLHLPGRSSLKEKRFVLTSVKTKLRQRFNVSVSEIDHHDKWQRATLAVVAVARDSAGLDRTFNEVRNLVGGSRGLELLDSRLELL